MTDSISGTKIRDRILKSRKVDLKPYTRVPVTPDQLETFFAKSYLMKYIEKLTGIDIESIVFSDTLDNIVKMLKSKGIDDIDRSTISRWRTKINSAREAILDGKFWENFT